MNYKCWCTVSSPAQTAALQYFTTILTPTEHLHTLTDDTLIKLGLTCISILILMGCSLRMWTLQGDLQHWLLH